MKHRSTTDPTKHPATTLTGHGYLLAIFLIFIWSFTGCTETPTDNNPDPTPSDPNAELPLIDGPVQDISVPFGDDGAEIVLPVTIIDGVALYQGDIVVAEVGSNAIISQGIGRNDQLWPNGVVPYRISGNFDPADKNEITRAIAHWNAKTNIRLIARTNEADYVHFIPDANSCSSHVGRAGGAQTIKLKSTCSYGNVVHEIGHAVGLWHEQSRSDRARYIEIKEENIQPEKRRNFELHDALNDQNLGSYDYGSIMHYGKNAFCIENAQGECQGPTIVTIPEEKRIGQRDALSPGDIAAVNSLYPAGNPPQLISFTASPEAGPAPLTTTFSWQVSDPSPDAMVRCSLDVNSDGTPEYDLPDCQAVTSQNHTYTDLDLHKATLTVTDGLNAPVSAFVLVAVELVLNSSPFVNAGPDQTTSVDTPLVLSGVVTDDGLPNPPARVEVLWSTQAGPGSVSFSNASSAVTEASFSEAGSYTLNLRADDGELTASDQLNVEVLPAAPVITEFDYTEDNNNDGVLEVDEFAFFAATAKGGVFGPYTWTVTPTPVDEEQVDPSEPGGEGALGFAIAFGSPGSHEVCVVVTDSISQSSGPSCLQVVVEDKPATNQAPEVTVNAEQTIKLSETASLSATVNDDGLPDPPATVTTLWTQISGPGNATIADPNALTTSTSFPQVGSYVFEFSAFDGALTSVASTTVVVEDNLVISNFTATPDRGNKPLEVAFSWAIAGLTGDETCTLTTGDGTNLPVSCDANTATHNYERLGSFTASLRVEPSDADPISREAAILVEPRSLNLEEGFSLVQADDGCVFSAAPFTTGDIRLNLNETEGGNTIAVDLIGSGSGTRNIVCTAGDFQADLTWQQQYTAAAMGSFTLEGELASFTIIGTLQGSGGATWSNCRDLDDEPVSCPPDSGGGYQFPVTFQGVANFSNSLSSGDIIVGDIGLPTQGSW